MTPKTKYYETLANTHDQKILKKRRMESILLPDRKMKPVEKGTFFPAIRCSRGSRRLHDIRGDRHDGCTAFSRYSVFRPGSL